LKIAQVFHDFSACCLKIIILSATHANATNKESDTLTTLFHNYIGTYALLFCVKFILLLIWFQNTFGEILSADHLNESQGSLEVRE
jgi:hypothetical protein